MQIRTIGESTYTATFNRREIQITNGRSLRAVDISTGEILAGDELRSVRSLLKWHLKSNADSNELPAFWTVRREVTSHE